MTVVSRWSGVERHCREIARAAKDLGFHVDLYLPLRHGGDTAVVITAPVGVRVVERGTEVELVCDGDK